MEFQILGKNREIMKNKGKELHAHYFPLSFLLKPSHLSRDSVRDQGWPREGRMIKTKLSITWNQILTFVCWRRCLWSLVYWAANQWLTSAGKWFSVLLGSPEIIKTGQNSREGNVDYLILSLLPLNPCGWGGTFCLALFPASTL